MNPHYPNNNEPDYLSISEFKLLELLEHEFAIGYLRKTSFQPQRKYWVYSEAPNYLSKYSTDFINFCSKTQLFDDIKKMQEPLFAPLLLTLAPVLCIENEQKIVEMIVELQDQYLKAPRTNQKELRLFDYLDYNLLNHCVKSIIDLMKHISLSS